MIEQHEVVDSVTTQGPTLLKGQRAKGNKNIPLPEVYQESGKIGDAVHVSFLIQDQDKADDPLFPACIDVQQRQKPINRKVIKTKKKKKEKKKGNIKEGV